MPRFSIGPRWPLSIRAYRLSRRGSDRPGRLRSGHPFVRIRRRTLGSIAWGLHPFVDPALPAPEASLCWLTSSTAPILEALCCRAPESASDLAIANLRSTKSIIVGPGREEYVLLGDSGLALTLRLRGSRAILGPVRTTFLLRGIPDTANFAADFATFDALLHVRSE